jgi:hypothetical protein
MPQAVTSDGKYRIRKCKLETSVLAEEKRLMKRRRTVNEKKPYHMPQLRTYGDVDKLTEESSKSVGIKDMAWVEQQHGGSNLK